MMFFTKMNGYQKNKCDTNKNVIKHLLYLELAKIKKLIWL
jgi:hypothetical protein